MGGGMQPRDVFEFVNAGDPRISPDGSRVAFAVTRLDEESNEYKTAIWVAPLDGSAEPGNSPRVRSATRRRAGRPTAAGSRSSSPRRRQDAREHLRHPRRRRRGPQAHRPEGERRGDRLVARLVTPRVHGARARRSVRGGGRAQARAASLHAHLPQARQRRLDRRPAEAHFRRRPRRRRADGSSRPATSSTTIPRGHPTASASSSTACAMSAGTHGCSVGST